MEIKHPLAKRFLSIALAAVLVLSCASQALVGVVSAVTPAKSVAVETVRLGYLMEGGETTAIGAGYIAGDKEISYTAPSDSDLISVNEQTKVITIGAYTDAQDNTWEAVSITLKGTDENVLEEATLSGNTYTYSTDATAFSVHVDYVLNVSKKDAQQTILDNYNALYLAVENVNKLVNGETGTKLAAVADALNTQFGNTGYTLRNVIEQLKTGMSDLTGTTTIKLGDDAAEAWDELIAQIDSASYGGNLRLVYESNRASSDVVGYMISNGSTYKNLIKKTANYIDDLASDPLFTDNKETAAQLLYTYGIIESEDSWLSICDTLSKAYTPLMNVYSSEYWKVGSDMSALLSAAGQADTASVSTKCTAETTLTVQESLKVATATVQFNMSMYDLTINVELNYVKDNAPVNNTATKTLTLAAGATGLTAHVDSFVENTLAGWTDYVAGQYEVVAYTVPGSLTENTVVNVVYNPVQYTVTGDATEINGTYYYGYKLTLPAHTDEAKSYDYTVNGSSYMQGDKITVTGDISITRTVGKAYTVTTLYIAIGENAGASEKLAAILASGAFAGVKVDQVINYRDVDTNLGEDDSYLYLSADGTLTAYDKDIVTSWNGETWTPYTANGTALTANGTAYTATGVEGDSAKVVYKLDLSSVASASDANKILALAKTLSEEAADQKEVLDKLYDSTFSNLKQLNKTVLGLIKEEVENMNASETVKADYRNAVEQLLNNEMNGTQLKIYYSLQGYNDGGLAYYYANATEFRTQLENLNDILALMLKTDEHKNALKGLLDNYGYASYADKINDLQTNINSYLEKLTAPNAAIITDDAEALAKLSDALCMEGNVTYTELTAAPYVSSNEVTVLKAGKTSVSYVVQIVGANGEVLSVVDTIIISGDIGWTLTAADLAVLDAKLAQVAGLEHYELKAQVSKPEANTTVSSNIKVEFNYVVKQYTVTFVNADGETVGTDTISVDDLTVELPKKGGDGEDVYRYTYNGKKYNEGTTLTIEAADLGNLVITCEVYNIYISYEETLNSAMGRDAFEIVTDANGNVTLVANLKDSEFMDFAKAVVLDGTYNSVSLGGYVLYDEDGLSLNALVNAVLNDNSFTSDRLITLGKNGKGTLLNTTIAFDDGDPVAFTLNLLTVPEQLNTVATGLEAIAGLMTFRANNGEILVEVNMPEKVYEVYLTALIATGYQSKGDLAAMDNEIVYQFMVDYLTMITENGDITTTTYMNTLSKFGYDIDLTDYEDYYRMVCNLLTDENLIVSENGISLTLTAAGQTAIDKMIALMGVDLGAYGSLLNVVKEYKENGELSVTTSVALKNSYDYKALVLDVDASGIANKFNYTTAPAGCTAVMGSGMVVLLGDVEGDLTFGTVSNEIIILDLNGYTISGNVTAKGTLYIVSTGLNTDSVGGVTGNISGNVVIIDGKYTADVSGLLQDGYQQVNGKVENALYSIDSDGTTATITINTDFMNDVDSYVSFAQSVAIDIALDVAMNYFTAASLSVDGKDLYCVNFNDLIGLLESDSKLDDILTKLVDLVNEEGVTYFANAILENLLDFDMLAEAVENGTPFATYTISQSPWCVTADKAEGDYLDITITANKDIVKSLTIKLQLSGENKNKLVSRLNELHNILPNAKAWVKLTDISYSNHILNIEGSAGAEFNIDLTTNEAYPVVIGVILANGGSAQKDALIAAINAGDLAALKAAFDKVTVAEVIDAVQAITNGEKFADLAEKNGVTVDTTDAETLESIYHIVLAGMGKVLRSDLAQSALDKIGISDSTRVLGSWDTDGDGLYVLLDKENVNRTGSLTARGFTVNYNLTLDSAELSVKVFGEIQQEEEEHLLGDVNHDGVIDLKDAMLVLEYYVNESSEGLESFCETCADVNSDGVIDLVDVMVILQMYNAEG